MLSKIAFFFIQSVIAIGVNFSVYVRKSDEIVEGF